MSSRVKNIIIFLIIFAIAAAIYYFFFQPKEEEAPLAVTTPGVPAPTGPAPSRIGQEFVNILRSVRGIKLDDSIFRSNEFNTLVDFSVPLSQKEKEGRPNPFAPLGEEKVIPQELVTTLEATGVTSSSATLNGSVAPTLIDAEKRFEWGPTQELEELTSIVVGTETGIFSVELTDLSPDTTYWFRAIVNIDDQVIVGDVLSFTTTP